MKTQTKKLVISTAISAAILSFSATGAMAHLEPKKGEDTEKCYGVVKAHKNDCASKAGKHSCSGRAKLDADKNEWIKLPSGLCEKLVGGALAESDQGSENEEPKQ
ncbi:MAG: membrane protein [Micavibrio sp.]|nr:MAG: membrane protein [Micavibrio sp.]